MRPTRRPQTAFSSPRANSSSTTKPHISTQKTEEGVAPAERARKRRQKSISADEAIGRVPQKHSSRILTIRERPAGQDDCALYFLESAPQHSRPQFGYLSRRGNAKRSPMPCHAHLSRIKGKNPSLEECGSAYCCTPWARVGLSPICTTRP